MTFTLLFSYFYSLIMSLLYDLEPIDFLQISYKIIKVFMVENSTGPFENNRYFILALILLAGFKR